MTPFAADPSQAISSLGETQLIRRIKEWLGDSCPPAPYGIGDDCSVLPPQTPNTQGLVTADPVIYSQHFDDSITPEQAAAKLVRRNLSDIAAMGGKPGHAVISLALSPSVSIPWIERFHRTIAEEAASFGFKIVGGDISSANQFLGAFLTLYGETLPGVAPLLRHAAKPGSPIFVTGNLGGTRIQKHVAFIPRLAEAQWIAQQGCCRSCTDLSDGIGKDHLNLIPQGLACQVDCSLLPLSDDARLSAKRSGHSATYHALNDGEDFELLFALAPQTDLSKFQAAWSSSFDTPLTLIGQAVRQPEAGAAPSPSLLLLNAPPDLTATGYEHLR